MKARFKKMLSLALTMLFALSAVPFTALNGSAATTYAVGDIIEFGGYPQSRVTDSNTVAALNAKVKDADWVSYGYYSGDGAIGSMEQGDWMKYCDIYLNGNKYRGVRFSQYRPGKTYAVSDETAPQADNGYVTDTNYWFLWETLTWRVLDPNTGFVMCEKLIDAQAFCNTIYQINDLFYGDAAGSIDANDYKNSSIRAWLNEDFYHTAFSETEQTEIQNTTIPNRSCDWDNSRARYIYYSVSTTTDHIYLLSYSDLTNQSYGFNRKPNDSDTARMAVATDYAACQGQCTKSPNILNWRARDAWYDETGYNGYVNKIGYMLNFLIAASTDCGIRPAFTFADGAIQESPFSVDCDHTNTVFVNNGDGTHTKRCAFCDFPLATAAHRLGEDYVITADGHSGLCPDCGAQAFTAHDENGEQIVADGTCTAAGSITYTCSVCETEVRTEETDLILTNHVNTVDVPETASTCIAHGYTAGVWCNDCETWISGHEEKPFVDHVWSETGTVTKPATCAAMGETTYPCTVEGCDTTITRTDVAIDPDNHVNTEEVAETESRCYEAGYTAGVWCGDCETWVSGHAEKPLAAHSWQEVERADATCRDEGYVDYACSVENCGATKRDTLPVDPDAHHLAIRVHPATCTDGGYTSYTCVFCRYGYTTDEQPALGHAWSSPEWKWSGTNAAATFTCANGDHPAVVNAAVTVETVKEPTDTEKGLNVYTATVEFDGKTYTDTLEKSIPSLNEGLCKWCGERHGSSFGGRIKSFFHNILYFFAHLFGRK